MTNSKKKVVYILIAVLLVIAATIGTILILKAVSDGSARKSPDTTQNPSTSTKAQADILTEQALQAVQNNENDKAKDLLLEAKQQFKDLNDINGVINIDAQLYLIDHPNTPPEVKTPSAPAASQ